MRGKAKHLLSSLLICLWISSSLGACNSDIQNPSPEVLPTDTSTAPQTTKAAPNSESNTQVITIWIPPMLGPETEAGSILVNHLNEFEIANEEIDVQLRVKEEHGTSGILETLSATSLAAPSKLPDIVVLSPEALNTATLKGLITPLDDLIEAPKIPEWYEYAIEAAYADNTFVGIPFASDAQAFAYRVEAYETEPRKWTDLIGSAETFLVPLGDENAIYSLVLYKEMGGSLTDETGYPTMDTDLLTDIFIFFSSANEAGILPLFLLQLGSPEDTWSSLQQGFANSAIVPLDTYLKGTMDEGLSVSPWPTRGGLGVVPTSTRVWAVVQKIDSHDEQVSEVMEWLEETAFMGELAAAMGMLPVKSGSLDHWPSPDQASTISRLIRVAISEPNLEEQATFGSSLRMAIEDVLNGRSTPEAAAKDVVNQGSAP